MQKSKADIGDTDMDEEPETSKTDKKSKTKRVSVGHFAHYTECTVFLSEVFMKAVAVQDVSDVSERPEPKKKKKKSKKPADE